MPDQEPGWLPASPPQPAEPRYLTTELSTRPPWAPPPPSPAHRLIVRGVIAASLALLAFVLWTQHAAILAIGR